MHTFSRSKKILLLSVMFFFLMMVVALFHEDGILRVYNFQEELTLLNQSNERLKEENINLRQDIAALKSESYAVEKIAREKLRLLKPGEMVYHIVSHENNSSVLP